MHGTSEILSLSRYRSPVDAQQRTLVTGASGFLGAHVVAAALARARTSATLSEPYGPPVFAQSRGSSLLVPRFGGGPRDAAEWLEFDFLEFDAGALLDELAPTEVIHCAALSSAAACEANPGAAMRLHRETSRRIASWCAEKGAKLVHVSTDLVFGAEDAPATGFTEDSDTGPVSVYGRTKLEAEWAVLEAAPTASVARLPLLYGNSGGRGLGASDSILESVEAGVSPKLFVDEWRTPLEVSNAAEALVELLEFESGGPVHLAGPDRINRYVFGIQVLRAMGLSEPEAHGELEGVSQAQVDTGAPRSRDVSLDATLASEHLETKLLGVVQGLERAIAP